VLRSVVYQFIQHNVNDRCRIEGLKAALGFADNISQECRQGIDVLLIARRQPDERKNVAVEVLAARPPSCDALRFCVDGCRRLSRV
jgi:hypothetical protein